jgi:hypothetical protein
MRSSGRTGPVAEARINRLQRVLEDGWDPEALTGQYNAAVAEKEAAVAGLEALEPPERCGYPRDGWRS